MAAATKMMRTQSHPPHDVQSFSSSSSSSSSSLPLLQLTHLPVAVMSHCFTFTSFSDRPGITATSSLFHRIALIPSSSPPSGTIATKAHLLHLITCHSRYRPIVLTIRPPMDQTMLNALAGFTRLGSLACTVDKNITSLEIGRAHV